jgi:hypothetical protein
MRDLRISWFLRSCLACAVGTLCACNNPPPYYEGPWTPEDVEGELAIRICSALSGCCEDLPVSQGCNEGSIPAHLRASVEAAEAAGLIFDGNAISSPDFTCSEIAEFGSILQCGPWSQLYYGDQPEGAPCDAVGHRMSDCVQGLVCGADRVCHQPCDIPHVASENQFCGPARGMWFVTCEPGLACDVLGTCQPAQAVGEECLSPTSCATEGWCDSGTCVADLPGGNPCNDHAQCQSDECLDGMCYEPTSAVCGRWAW